MRTLLALAGALLATAAVAVVPAPPSGAVSAQADSCLPPGERIVPVPWAQRLLAPERAWSLTTGAGQRVAVVSTGVDETPFLAGSVSAQVDLAPQPQFGEPSGEPDCLGIGTGVAGVIAARPTEGVGFQGVAPDARILPVKIVGDQFPSDREPAGTVAPGLLAEGIDRAVGEDATVIVVPTITFQDSAALADAVAAALAAGIVVVASVGEAGQNDEPPDLVPYPAAYDGVIGVGALAIDGTASISRPGEVDLVAPGADLTITYPGDGLGPAGGTGFAAGYVAGVVALVRSYRPELSPAEVAHRLFATAAPAPEAAGSARYGYGIVNPYPAVADRVVAGEPAPQPPYVPAVVSQEERDRQAARQRSDALATRLVLIGLAATAVTMVAVGFGSKGRRRRWRAGIVTLPVERPEDENPEPPMDLFGARPSVRENQGRSGY